MSDTINNMSNKSFLYGTPVIEWTTPPAADCEVSPKTSNEHNCRDKVPKAIVSPLIGGVVQTQSHRISIESRSKKLTCIDSDGLQSSDDVEGLKTILVTKDRILAQKTRLIERQRQSIANLQLQLRENETRCLTMATEVHRKNVPTLSARIKELEYENVSLKAQLKGIMQKKHNLQLSGRKLSTAEFEFAKSVSESTRSRTCTCVCADMNEGQRKKDKEVERLKEELTDNSLLLKKFKDKCLSLDVNLAALQSKELKIVSECQKLQRLLFESEAHCRHELQAMRDRHKQRFVEATAELRLRHKTMAKRVRALELQLLRNSDVVSALNSEVQISHGTIGDLKVTLKELVSQNQHLVEQNLSLQECTLKEHSLKNSSDTSDMMIQQLTVESSYLGRFVLISISYDGKLGTHPSDHNAIAGANKEERGNRQLLDIDKLAICIEDFESLVKLCSSLLEGCDPSASLVLGVKGNHSVLGSSDAQLALDDNIGAKLIQVKQLKAKVDHLREVLSEQFASQISNACQVQ